MTTYEIPEDLGPFWEEAFEESRLVPLHFKRSPTAFTSPSGHRIDEVEFRSVGGAVLRGWIAFPDGARRERAFVWVPPYGRESLLPNEFGTRAGCVSLGLNLHGLGAFHQEKYVPSRGYFAEGTFDPRTWIFRRLAQHVMVALRVLEAQGEADESRIGLMGMSQGAGLSIWAGALSPIARAVCADMPFLGQMDVTLSRNAYRYPLKELVDAMEDAPLGWERGMHMLSYFDTAYLATRLTKPTLVSLGEKDPACRPESVMAVYEALAAQTKRLVRYDGGHDWDPEMVHTNDEWMRLHLG